MTDVKTVTHQTPRIWLEFSDEVLRHAGSRSQKLLWLIRGVLIADSMLQAFYEMKGQFSESHNNTIRESLLKFWTCSNAVRAARDELFGPCLEKAGSEQAAEIWNAQTMPYFASPHEMSVIIVTATDMMQDRWLKTRFVEKYPDDAVDEFQILAMDQSCEAQ